MASGYDCVIPSGCIPVGTTKVRLITGALSDLLSNLTSPNRRVQSQGFKARRESDGPYALIGIDGQLLVSGLWPPHRKSIGRQLDVVHHTFEEHCRRDAGLLRDCVKSLFRRTLDLVPNGHWVNESAASATTGGHADS